jgi:flagellar assembly protein FliH
MPAGTSQKSFSLNPFIRNDQKTPDFRPAAVHPQSPKVQFQFHPQMTRYLEELQEQVYQELKKKAAQIEHEAYEKGFAQGEKDGMESGQKRLEVVIKQINALLAQIENQQRVLFQRFEHDLVEFAFCVIKKVLRRESRLTAGVIKDTLSAALEKTEENRRVILHVNPLDYKYLLAHPDQIPWILNDRERIKILEDEAITPGGGLLETEWGVIDATLEGQFDQIVEKIQCRLPQEEKCA